MLIGDTGLGKTAWLQNLVVSTPSLSCLYLSLEVHDHLIYRRFLQIANGITKERVMDLHSIDKHESDELKNAITPIEHINVMTSTPEIGSMKQLITELSPKIVVIDTIDVIKVNYNNDPFNKTEIIINELKQLAVQEGIIIVGVSHISKSASFEQKLTVHSSKGNSVIEQKADKVIGIMGERDAKRRVLKSLKSRDEARFQIALTFDYETFRFKEMQDA
jgi:predicted ATP-dependent serine protease